LASTITILDTGLPVVQRDVVDTGSFYLQVDSALEVDSRSLLTEHDTPKATAACTTAAIAQTDLTQYTVTLKSLPDADFSSTLKDLHGLIRVDDVKKNVNGGGALENNSNFRRCAVTDWQYEVIKEDKNDNTVTLSMQGAAGGQTQICIQDRATLLQAAGVADVVYNPAATTSTAPAPSTTA